MGEPPEGAQEARGRGGRQGPDVLPGAWGHPCSGGPRSSLGGMRPLPGGGVPLQPKDEVPHVEGCALVSEGRAAALRGCAPGADEGILVARGRVLAGQRARLSSWYGASL